jgi:hypothetical protein
MSSEKVVRDTKDRDVTRIAQVTGMAARAGVDAIVSGRTDSAAVCCRRAAARGVEIGRRILSAMVPVGGSRPARSGGLQRICITVCLGLPVAYLEAFVVQSAFTPRAGDAVTSVGDMLECSTMHPLAVKQEDLRIIVRRSEIRFASRGMPHTYETKML